MTAPAQAPASRWGTSGDLRVACFALLLAVVATVALALSPLATIEPALPFRASPLVAALIGAGFLLCELRTLEWEHGEHAQSHSLIVVPLLFAVVLLSPLDAVVVTVAASGVGYCISSWRLGRFSLLKWLWNGALWAAITALAALTIRHAVGIGQPAGWEEWAVVAAVMLLVEAASAVAVGLAIAVYENRLGLLALVNPGRSHLITLVGSCFALTALAASLVEPLLLVCSAVPLIAVASLLQVHGRLTRAHRDLHDLHAFTSALDEVEDDTILQRLLLALSASGVALVERGQRGVEVRLVDEAGTRTAPPEPFVGVVPLPAGTAMARLRPADDPRLAPLFELLQAEEVLVVPLADDHGPIAALVAYGRTGYRCQFTNDEAALFNSLARAFASRLVNRRLSRRDHLTGMPNREAFTEALHRAVTACPSGVVIQLDLLRFREINESLGHSIGDKVLVQVANRMLAGVRTTDVVARVGGDEFSILIEGELDADGLARRVEDLRLHLRRPVVVDGLTFDIGVSVGAARWPADGRHGTELLARAEIALARAKNADVSFVAFDESFDVATPRRLALASDLRGALDQGEIDVHLQPKVDLASGHVVGAEALARWNHPGLGPVPPSEFIPLVEQSGLGGRLTRLVLARAADSAADLKRLGLPIPIAVNLTPRDLLDPSLPGVVDDLLAERDLPGPLLEVEITEGAMVVDFETSLATLQRLRVRGVTVAVDDFGTGYSSLTYLHRLPVDCLKIDRSFIAALARDDTAAAIVRSSIRLAHDLGMSVVAEGVEDAVTLALLTSRGCDQAQGYLLARPMPANDFLHWMIDHHDDALPEPPRAPARDQA